MSVLGKVEIVVCGVLGDVEAWELARRSEQHAAWALTQARAEMESVYPGLEFVIRIGEHGPKPEPERELGAPQGIRINGRGPVIKPEAER